MLHEHLTSGPKNAKYTSKTIQNEILEIAADQVREFYCSCLHNCPHFSLIADEVIFIKWQRNIVRLFASS